MFDLIDKLEDKETLEREEWITLLSAYQDDALRDYAAQKARAVAQSVYGHDVYVRGLIEFTNYCRNDCYYCGIRRSNPDADRYRLTKEDILACCEEGWELGFRTFVLQGGEDGYFRDEWYEELIHEIKQRYPKCAVTLSVGERSGETYRRWYEAGADRYLLRHETADDVHYRSMHPQEMSPEHRKKCLYTLREIGYQVGCGKGASGLFSGMDNTNLIIMIIVLVVTSPIWGSALLGIASFLLGLLGALVGIFAALVLGGGGSAISGIVAIVAGFIALFAGHAASGVLTIGVGCLLFSLGSAFCYLGVFLAIRLIPLLWRQLGRLWDWCRIKLLGKEASC